MIQNLKYIHVWINKTYFVYSIQYLAINNTLRCKKNDSTRNTNKSSLLPVSQERIYQTRTDQGIRSNSAGL